MKKITGIYRAIIGLAACLALLALAACQTTKMDQVVASSLPKICSAATVAHTAFLAYVQEAKVSARDQRAEAAAYASMQGICADPANQNSATVLVAAATAYGTIAAALRDNSPEETD